MKIFDLQNNSKLELLSEVKPEQDGKVHSKEAFKSSDYQKTFSTVPNESSFITSFMIFKRRIPWMQLKDRQIISNEPDQILDDNRIDTSKYTCLSFLPKNMFLEFSKPGNVEANI